MKKTIISTREYEDGKLVFRKLEVMRELDMKAPEKHFDRVVQPFQMEPKK